MAKKKSESVHNFMHKWAVRYNLNYFGMVLGSLFFILSLTPSLMPRGWFLQAFVGGISFAAGYGIGVFVSWAFRGLFQYEFSAKVKKNAWNLFPVIGGLLLAVFLIMHYNTQTEIREIGGFEEQAWYMLIPMLLLSDLFAALFIYIGKGVRVVFEWLMKQFNKVVPKRVGLALGLIFATILTVWTFNGFLLDSALSVADSIYASKNQSDPEGYAQPIWPEHSGSPESLLAWDTLGYQGKKFVAETSTVEEMEEFSGEPAEIGIRIYAGVDSADTPKERADLVVEEMRRTNAMDREVLLVITPTGTGWIEPNAIRAIEHMYNGDIAIVAQQYSYLPSWIATIVDPARAQETGRTLFETVYEEWASYPEAQRPELIVHGLSLGSFGMQSAFSSTSDMMARTDGALFLGTPSFSQPWRRITENRDEGSYMVRPIYEDRKDAVFAGTKDEILEEISLSEPPRILFQQHASDGVVWWNPDLILHEADWFKEPAGTGVIDGIFWMPVVSFFQVTVDQAVAGGAPDGFGHNYRDTLVYAWSAVTQPDGWTLDKAEALQNKIFVVEAKGGSNQ